MGETPTHGKIKVSISRNSPKAPSLSREGSSSCSAAAAVEAACMASACGGGSGGEGSGLDSGAGDGPLDASGRPGWSIGDSGKGCVSVSVHTDGKDDGSAGANADTAGGAVFKTVEWYGTIRLLVFVKEGILRC